MPNPKKREFRVGDRVLLSLPGGRIEEGIIKAITERTDGVRLQVAYGNDQTTLAHEWQVRRYND